MEFLTNSVYPGVLLLSSLCFDKLTNTNEGILNRSTNDFVSLWMASKVV